MQYEFDIILRDLKAALSKEGNVCGNKDRIARCIEYCISTIKSMNQWMDDHPFENVDEEIHFYKTVRPQFISLFFYYKTCLKLERQMPGGSIKKKATPQRIQQVHRCFLLSAS